MSELSTVEYDLLVESIIFNKENCGYSMVLNSPAPSYFKKNILSIICILLTVLKAGASDIELYYPKV